MVVARGVRRAGRRVRPPLRAGRRAPHAHSRATASRTRAGTRTHRPAAGTLPAGAFDAHDHDNPVVAGRLRRHDCSQITDGGAAVILASAEYATEWAASHCIDLEARPPDPRLGSQHRADGLRRQAARRRAVRLPARARRDPRRVRPRRRGGRLGDSTSIECHDCFTTTHYMAIDHFGITAAGRELEGHRGRHRPVRRPVADQPERRPHRLRASRRRVAACGCCSTSRSR